MGFVLIVQFILILNSHLFLVDFYYCECFISKIMKHICCSLGLLALSASAQGFGLLQNDHETFIGGSYGFAADGEDSTSGLQGDFLWSFETGAKYKHAKGVTSTLSLEFLGTFYEDVASFTENGYAYSTGLQAQNTGVFVNYRVGYDVNRFLSIYAGGGIGAVFSQVEAAVAYQSQTNSLDSGNVSGEETYTTFGYQAVAGVEVKPVSSFAIFAQYRYLSGSEIDDLSIKAIDDSFVDVGARFYF